MIYKLEILKNPMVYLIVIGKASIFDQSEIMKDQMVYLLKIVKDQLVYHLEIA